MESILPPQPPPDAPAPPPGPEADASQAKMTIIYFLGAVSVVVVLICFILPVLSRSRTRLRPDRTEAINNIKQVNLALLEFENDYGAFPDTSTISAVKAATGTALTLGSSSSNELFRQIFAAGITKSEKIFWAKSAVTPRKPNDVLAGDTLKKGECAFAYIAGLSGTSDPSAPVAMAPLIPGTWKFDPKPYGGFAVLLRIDGSAKPEPIDKNGDVMIGGMNLFDPRQPYWHGKAPDIKWPE